MNTPPPELSHGDVPNQVQTALEAAGSKISHPMKPVAKEGNETIFWTGEWDLSESEIEWTEDTCEVFQWIPNTFPRGNPHWTVITPAVSVEGQERVPDRNDRPGDDARKQPILDLGYSSALPFSWQWKNTGEAPSEPSDLSWTETHIRSVLKLEV